MNNKTFMLDEHTSSRDNAAFFSMYQHNINERSLIHVTINKLDEDIVT